MHRHVGADAGRIRKGQKPTAPPVIQPRKFEAGNQLKITNDEAA
jgi:hypothetical protein